MSAGDEGTIEALQAAANRLRILSIEATNASNSGHPTSCASAAEIVATLFLKVMKYDVKDGRNPNNDRFILSKGHAAPVLYAAWTEAGIIKPGDILNLRKIDNDLEGHPTPRLPFVDVATGSLGQGLSAAAGMAIAGKRLDQAGKYRVFCLIGDGESAEGSIWEALSFSSHYKLDNLCAIFDINRLGQSEATQLQHDIDTYRARVSAFGWNTIVVDGHNVNELLAAFDAAEKCKDKPTAILAKTFKGNNMTDEICDKDDWHGKPMGAKAESIIAQLQTQVNQSNTAGVKLTPVPASNELSPLSLIGNVSMCSAPDYKLGDQVATRMAYGNALKKLGEQCDRVIGLDGDTKNSTFSIKLMQSRPNQYVECFIAEQNLVGVAIGMACRQRAITFASTFACFFTRAADQLRMAAISQSNANFAGSHVGVSIGEDGPSQMGLEDLALFRSICGSTVFYPSDAVSCERAVELAANTKGICYIRTGRPNAPVIYAPESAASMQIGKARVVRESATDQVTIVAAGVTLVEALKVADSMPGKIRVVDPFTIKPIDKETLVACAKATNGNVVTVEDHYPEGGLGEAVMAALAGERNVSITQLAVRDVPRSGKSAELMTKFGIDCVAIEAAVKKFF